MSLPRISAEQTRTTGAISKSVFLRISLFLRQVTSPIEFGTFPHGYHGRLECADVVVFGRVACAGSHESGLLSSEPRECPQSQKNTKSYQRALFSVVEIETLRRFVNGSL